MTLPKRGRFRTRTLTTLRPSSPSSLPEAALLRQSQSVKVRDEVRVHADEEAVAQHSHVLLFSLKANGHGVTPSPNSILSSKVINWHFVDLSTQDVGAANGGCQSCGTPGASILHVSYVREEPAILTMTTSSSSTARKEVNKTSENKPGQGLRRMSASRQVDNSSATKVFSSRNQDG